MSHEWHKKGFAITFCKALFLLFYISLCDILYYISSCNIVHHSQEEHRSALLDGVYERTVDYELHAGHVKLGGEQVRFSHRRRRGDRTLFVHLYGRLLYERGEVHFSVRGYL